MRREKSIAVLAVIFLVGIWCLPAGALGDQIDLNDFWPEGPVTISGDGASAALGLDEANGYSILQNDPIYGDPGISITSEAVWLSFYYDFTEATGSDTLFSWWLTDEDGSWLSDFGEDLGESQSGFISLDLSAYVGEILGMTFQLYEYATNPSGYLTGSTVTISNLQMTAAPVPEPGTCLLLGSGLLGLAGLRRRFSRSAA